jgi:hypothetical protein
MRNLVALGLAVLTSWPAVAVQAANVVVSGQSNLVVIDGDGDGPDATDCRVTATVDAFDNFTVSTQQDSETPILFCADQFFGSLFRGTDSSSDYLGATVNSDNLSLPEVPVRGEFVDEQANPDGPPVRIDDPLDYLRISNPDTNADLANVLPCTANGAAAVVRVPGATSFLVQTSFFTDNSNQTYVVAPQLTFGQTAPNLNVPVLLDAYIPVTSGHEITVALDSAPNDLLLDIDLDELPPCRGRQAAPTLTEWGLLVLATALLSGGTWMLRRRPTFAGLVD